MAKKLTHYQASGFYLISKLQTGGLKKWGVHATTTITKGQALAEDTAGYATDMGANLAATFIGIAAEACDNSTGAAGAKSVMVIPPFNHNQFAVPADTATLAQTDIGELVDTGADGLHIDPSDAVTTGWAFIIDEIDISAEAVAANTRGYAVGHFEQRAAQS